MFSLPILAQDTLPTVQYYYVEERNVDGLKPTNKTRLTDHSLDLTFSNTSLQTFFDNKTVYVYKKAFPGAINKRLQNMYLVGFDDFNLSNPIKNLNEVVYVDYIGTLQYESLGENPPNDYESSATIPTQIASGLGGGPEYQIPGLPKEHLDLVNAPMAWHITTGDSNIAIGMVDGPFYPSHPDLQNKIITHYGTTWNPTPGNSHQHGTKMAGVAAADTDNNLGIASIGYNSSLITCNAHNGNFTPQNPHPFDNASTIAQNMLFLVQNQTTIKFFIDEGDIAVMMLTNTLNNIQYNYVLDNTKDFIDIDLSGISSGQYIVNLISGNQVLDTKNLIIN